MSPQSQNAPGSTIARVDARSDLKRGVKLASLAIPNNKITLLNVGMGLARSDAARDETASSFALSQHRRARLACGDDCMDCSARSVDTPAGPGIGRFAQQFIIGAVPANVDNAS